MDQPTYSLPRTVEEGQALLRVLTLPQLTAETLHTIGRKEGMQFKTALVDAANGAPNAEAQMKYLKAVITACSPATRAAIIELGFEMPPVETIIDLSKQEGTIFAASVRSLKAANGDPASIHTSKTYLRKALASVCAPGAGAGAAPTPPAPPPQDHPNAPAAPPAPAAAQAPARAQPPAQQPTRAATPPNNVARLPERREASRAAPPAGFDGRDGRDEPAAQGESGSEGRKFLSHHLYGGKAALCFSLDETRKGSMPTVRVEAAPAQGARSYDWNKKVSFQLTLAELPLVFGVLFGFTKKIELSGHGEGNEKSLSIEDQDSKYFMSMRVRQGGQGGVLAVPVLPKDTFAIMTMIFGQMKANAPNLSDNQIMAIAKRVCEKQQAPAQPRAANG